MELKYFETFAGTGTGGLALDNHGCINVGYSEFDPYAIKNYNANFPNRINYGDITKIKEDELPDFDIIIGGSPCQNISIMRRRWTEGGKDEGLDGEESKLFYDYLRILNQKLPKWFIFENVQNLINANNGEDFEIVKGSFEKNYNIRFKIMNTAKYGIPQTRRRLYIVGQRKDLGDFNYDFPTEVKLKITAFNLLEKTIDDKYYLSQKMFDYVMSEGTKNFKQKPETDLKIARPLTATMHKMHRAGTDNYYNTEYHPVGKTKLRKITPREAARFQGLPDTYKIVVSDTQAYKLMGNAMSYNVVDKIVENLILYINNIKP